MRSTEINGKDAVRVLSAMLTDPVVVGRVAAKWDDRGLFASREENRVAMWAIKHHRDHGVPLGIPATESRFEAWAASQTSGGLAEKKVQLFESLLVQIFQCSKATPPNSAYVVDLAGKLFTRVRYEKLLRDLEVDLEENNLDSAEKRVAAAALKVDLGQGDQIIRPGRDLDVWVAAFDAPTDEHVLIRYPGPLGRFLGADLSRECFVAITAATSVGKSWWLMDFGVQAVRGYSRVAFFEAGDMSERQFMIRLGQRASRLPKRAGDVEYPIAYETCGEAPQFETRRLEAVGSRTAFEAWRKLQRGADLFRLRVHPNDTLTVDEIRRTLLEWANAGWVADVVIVDYADILAPPVGVADERSQINHNWKQMRRLSQELHCLFLTATQADAESYDRKLITKRNFSNDRRKNDHLTANLGLNATPEEMQWGVRRVNFLKRREDSYSETQRQVYVAGCLAIGRPIVHSLAFQRNNDRNDDRQNDD